MLDEIASEPGLEQGWPEPGRPAGDRAANARRLFRPAVALAGRHPDRPGRERTLAQDHSCCGERGQAGAIAALWAAGPGAADAALAAARCHDREGGELA